MRSSLKTENAVPDVLNVAYKGYKDGSVDFIGDKVQIMTGYSRDVFNSREKKWIDVVLDEDRAYVQDVFRKALKSDKTYMREYRIRKKNGDVAWMQEWAQIACDDQGAIEFVTGILVDITTQKKSEEARLEVERLTGKYLIFSLDDVDYGLEISKAKEIIGMMDITSVPQTPAFVKGVFNLRGKVIPLIDLRLKLSLDSAGYTERTCIVVVEVQSREEIILIGAVVDVVSEVLNINGEDIESAPTLGDDRLSEYILGMAKIEGGVKILLDIDKVLSPEEHTLLKNVA